MTLHAKRMLEGDAVKMTEVSGLCSDSFREESIKESVGFVQTLSERKA